MQRFDGDFDPTAKGSVASTQALTMTFLTLGVIYLIFMMIGVALIRLPQGYGGHDDTVAHHPGRNGALVRANEAIKTRQFWLLWIVLFCNVSRRRSTARAMQPQRPRQDSNEQQRDSGRTPGRGPARAGAGSAREHQSAGGRPRVGARAMPLLYGLWQAVIKASKLFA